MVRLVDVYEDGVPRKHSAEFLYELLKERTGDPDVNISHKTLPTWTEHTSFIDSHPYRFWYLVEWLQPGGEPLWVGYISATANNEIGIVLQRHARGQGLGQMAIRLFMNGHKPNPESRGIRSGDWLANIAPTNEPSKRAFQKLGFAKIQETYSKQP